MEILTERGKAMTNKKDSEVKVEDYKGEAGDYVIKNGKYASVFNLKANKVTVFDLDAVEFNNIVSGPERETEFVGEFNLKSYKKFAGKNQAKQEVEAVKEFANSKAPQMSA